MSSRELSPRSTNASQTPIIKIGERVYVIWNETGCRFSGVVQAVSERIAVMNIGEIVELGPTGQILDSPNAAFTKALIGANPSIPDAKELSRLLGTRFPTSRGV